VPGTELTAARRGALVRHLTIAGWLLLGGPIGFLAFQLERVRNVDEQPFGSLWDQRIEVMSFLMLPPNLVVLAPVVFTASFATWLVAPGRDPWVTTLLRVAALLTVAFGAIGVVSILSIVARDDPGPADADGVMLRLGGVAMAFGLAMICHAADRTTRPAPSTPDAEPG
jgi:hypothetical protein